MPKLLLPKIKRLALTFLLALLLALALPHAAHALGFLQEAPPPVQLPDILVDAIAGWVTFHLLEAFKKYLPQLAGSAALLASFLIAAAVTLLNDLLAGVRDPVLVLLAQNIFNFLIAWLVSQGMFLKVKKDRAALQNALIAAQVNK